MPQRFLRSANRTSRTSRKTEMEGIEWMRKHTTLTQHNNTHVTVLSKSNNGIYDNRGLFIDDVTLGRWRLRLCAGTQTFQGRNGWQIGGTTHFCYSKKCLPTIKNELASNYWRIIRKLQDKQGEKMKPKVDTRRTAWKRRSTISMEHFWYFANSKEHYYPKNNQKYTLIDWLLTDFPIIIEKNI